MKKTEMEALEAGLVSTKRDLILLLTATTRYLLVQTIRERLIYSLTNV